MKNKTKKILAGACLGIVGAGLLTGCALTDDQMNALNVITDKADEIVDLLEENMALQNAQLSKTDAVELVALARTKLVLNKYETLYVKTISEAYQGFWEKSMGSAQGIAPFVYYKKNDNMKFVALCDFDETLYSIRKANFENNTAYDYDAQDDKKTDREFNVGMFDLGSQLDIMTLLGFADIGVEDIVNIENTEDGYKFNVLSTIYDTSDLTSGYQINTLMATFEISKDANFKSGTFDSVMKSYTSDELKKDKDDKVILDENGLPIIRVNSCSNIVSLAYNVEYKYSDIDFKFIEDKIAELEA